MPSDISDPEFPGDDEVITFVLGDPDEHEIPPTRECGDCGTPWSDHQGGNSGVTAGECRSFNYVPEGW